MFGGLIGFVLLGKAFDVHFKFWVFGFGSHVEFSLIFGVLHLTRINDL